VGFDQVAVGDWLRRSGLALPALQFQTPTATATCSHCDFCSNLGAIEYRATFLPNTSSDTNTLTQRQREIMGLAAKGLTNADIAGLLEISPGTVKVHMAAIYRVMEVSNRTEAATAWQLLERQAPEAKPANDLGAIAVLPFDNMSDDPNQQIFADGLVEELTTRLSRWHWFPVISRQSAFSYRNKGLDVSVIGAELGATFVVEGSVRRSETQVRVTGQLIDARTNRHLWADTYDGLLADAFDMQDDISRAIAGAIHPELMRSETTLARSHTPSDINAWQLATKALALVESRTQAGCREGITLSEQALAADETCLLAAFTGCMGHYQLLAFQWCENPFETGKQVIDHANLCQQLAPDDAYSHIAQGTSLMLQGNVEGALDAMRQATEHNPSSAKAFSFLGQLTGMRGDPEEGIKNLEQAIRLSPRDPSLYSMRASIGICHFGAGDLEAACHHLHQAADLKGDEVLIWSMLASASALAGRQEEAELAVAELIRIQPEFTLAGLRAITASMKPEYFAQFERGIRQAGFDG